MSDPGATLSRPSRYAPVQLFHHRVAPRLEIPELVPGPNQTHATADVETHPAGRHDAAVVDIRRRHPADGESVAPMDVGHGERGLLYPGQVGHIGHLVQRTVGQHLVHESV